MGVTPQRKSFMSAQDVNWKKKGEWKFICKAMIVFFYMVWIKILWMYLKWHAPRRFNTPMKCSLLFIILFSYFQSERWKTQVTLFPYSWLWRRPIWALRIKFFEWCFMVHCAHQLAMCGRQMHALERQTGHVWRRIRASTGVACEGVESST